MEAERFKDYCRLKEEKEQRIFDDFKPTMDAIATEMAKTVVEFPEMAGFKQQVGGSFERGDIGAVTLEYPTLEQAKEWLAEHEG